MSFSVLDFFKRDVAIKVKINKFNTNKVMVLSESLDKGDVISRAINFFLFVLEHVEDEYVLYFLPPKRSKKPGFKLALSGYVPKAVEDSSGQDNSLEIYSINLIFKAISGERVTSVKNFLMSQFSLTEISDEFFVNLALIVYQDCLEFSKREGYKMYMIPEESSGKKILAITNY